MAKPVRGLVLQSIDLRYDPSRQDGNRLVLKIDGKEVKSPPIMDWQLMPTVAFADDTDEEGQYRVGMVNLCGKLKNGQKPPKYSLVCNLHPAFENTRAGLLLSLFDYELTPRE